MIGTGEEEVDLIGKEEVESDVGAGSWGLFV